MDIDLNKVYVEYVSTTIGRWSEYQFNVLYSGLGRSKRLFVATYSNKPHKASGRRAGDKPTWSLQVALKRGKRYNLMVPKIHLKAIFNTDVENHIRSLLRDTQVGYRILKNFP